MLSNGVIDITTSLSQSREIGIYLIVVGLVFYILGSHIYKSILTTKVYLSNKKIIRCPDLVFEKLFKGNIRNIIVVQWLGVLGEAIVIYLFIYYLKLIGFNGIFLLSVFGLAIILTFGLGLISSPNSITNVTMHLSPWAMISSFSVLLSWKDKTCKEKIIDKSIYRLGAIVFALGAILFLFEK